MSSALLKFTTDWNSQRNERNKSSTKKFALIINLAIVKENANPKSIDVVVLTSTNPFAPAFKNRNIPMIVRITVIP